jgi:hypothetical protein
MRHAECNEVSALASARPSTCVDQKAKGCAMKFMDAALDLKALMMFDDLMTEADDFSSDSDCSFYEIESHASLMLHLNVEITAQETSSRSPSSKISPSQYSTGMDRRRYRAWIGSNSLHLA